MPLGSLLNCFGRQPAPTSCSILKADTLITAGNIGQICKQLTELKAEGVRDSQFIYLMHASKSSASSGAVRSISALEVAAADSNSADLMLMSRGRGINREAATQEEIFNYLYKAVIDSSCVNFVESWTCADPISNRKLKQDPNALQVSYRRKLSADRVLYFFKLEEFTSSCPYATKVNESWEVTECDVKSIPKFATVGWLKSVLLDLKVALEDSNGVVGFDSYAVTPLSTRNNFKI